MNKYHTTIDLELTVVSCYRCGVYFGMDEQTQRNAYHHGATFYCPNGHGQIYGDTLEKQLENAKADAEWWKDAAERTGRQLTATRGVVTRMKNRIANGVCPCCHRQFVNLHRHMQTKHPDWQEGEVSNG